MSSASRIINTILTHNPQSPCVATQDTIYNYSQVYKLVQQCSLNNSLFKPQQNLTSIITILRYFYEKRALQLQNPMEPNCQEDQNLINATLYIPTSGTQKQKLVALCEDALVFSALNLHPEFNLSALSSYALQLPLYHISGLMILIRTLLHGGMLVLKKSPLFHQASHISMCTNQLEKILDANHFPNLKALLLGGGPISYKLCKKATALGYPIFTTYGLSEMASQVTTAKFNPDKPMHMGKPLRGRHLKISKSGNIWVKGKTLFRGYHNANATFDNDGYFQTSDRGALFDYGLVLYSRIDNCIISGAENIHLKEIQTALLSIKGIQKVEVKGRKDPLYSERPVAICWCKNTLKKEYILKILEKKLMKYKIPFANDLYLKKFIN